MRYQEIINESENNFLSVSDAKAVSSRLVLAAQGEYDLWDAEDTDTYGRGGICHLIANAMMDVLQSAGIAACPVESETEPHTYVVFQVKEGVFSLDIPWQRYETQGDNDVWSKLPNITFNSSSLKWSQVSRDPDDFDQYLEGDEYYD